jgi:DMSO/TMAO reductase YedYZ molybdopterin-dependent catalytic subunit
MQAMSNAKLTNAKLKIDGEIERALALSFDDLAAMDERHQVRDVSRIDPKRKGDAVTLIALLEKARPKESVQFLTLHASTDDFHASFPLAAVSERAIVIYRLEGQPLPASAGGPFRFYIPDFAACHTAEVDECANVKFVDAMELTSQRGRDNRPHDGAAHEALHQREVE